MSNPEPDFKPALKYLHGIVENTDNLVSELKAFKYPEFKPMIEGMIAARVGFCELIAVVNAFEYPDDELPQPSNDNVIPMRKKPENQDT